METLILVHWVIYERVSREFSAAGKIWSKAKFSWKSEKIQIYTKNLEVEWEKNTHRVGELKSEYDEII